MWYTPPCVIFDEVKAGNYRALTAFIPPRTPSAPDPWHFGCLDQKWSGIRIRIPGLIRIRSAGSLPKCIGFIPLTVYPHKWSPVSWRSSADSESSPVKDQRSTTAPRLPYKHLTAHRHSGVSACSVNGTPLPLEYCRSVMSDAHFAAVLYCTKRAAWNGGHHGLGFAWIDNSFCAENDCQFPTQWSCDVKWY